MGQQGATQIFHATEAFPITEFCEQLPKLLEIKKIFIFPELIRNYVTKFDTALDENQFRVQTGALKDYAIP